MNKKTKRPYSERNLQLNEEEASKLAEELKQQLIAGETPPHDAENINRIVAGLGDKRGLLRRTFSEGLGAIGKAAFPALRKALLYHPNITVRRAAAKTLRLVGEPKALPDLLEALINDPDPVVQGSAAGAMAVFGEDAVKLLLTVLIKPNSNSMQRGLARWALAFVGAEAPKALKKAAKSKHSEIRSAAIAALGDQIQSLGDQEAREIVLIALNDESKEVRAEATALLGNLQEPNWAYPFLIRKLNDKEPEVRKSSALSLMRLNAFNSINELSCRQSIEEDSTVINILNLAINQLNKSKKEVDQRANLDKPY